MITSRVSIANSLTLDQWLLFSAGGGQFGGGGQNPYSTSSSFGPQQPPPKKSKAWLWILVGVGLAGVLGLVCCGGLGLWGFSLGTQVLGDELKKAVAGNADVQQHLGDVESVSMNIMATGEEGPKRPGRQVLVFDAKGSTGSGKFIVEQSRNPQPGDMFEKIDLKLPSGETVSVK